MNTEKTGAFIAELRRQKELTQQQLADKINVSAKAVSRWETGRGFPDIINLESIAEALDISVAEILRGERLPETVTNDEMREIASDGLSLTRTFVTRKKYINFALGFLLGLLVLALAVIHMTSPIYIKDPGMVKIEEMSDGQIVAVVNGNAAGYDLDRVSDPDRGSNMTFISCYETRWSRMRGTGSETLVLLGDKDELGEVYYYPTDEEDVLIYGAAPEQYADGGVVTLPRLVYNYWIILGAAFTVIGFALAAVLRGKYYGRALFKLAMLPAAFTISILLCLAGRFDEVYNASYYLSGILLLTIVLYLIFLIVYACRRYLTHAEEKKNL